MARGRGGQDQHIQPAARHQEHDDSRDCWCDPDTFVLCGECGGDPDGCWKCRSEGGPNGMVPEQWGGDGAMVVVHNDIEPPG